MDFSFYQVDAFTNKAFGGNPAAVIPLESWLPDPLMQQIATEMNLSETAFFVPLGENKFHLRWFTPTIEANFCGHATLATSLVIQEHLHIAGQLTFDTMVGPLYVNYRGNKYEMNLPAASQEERKDLLPSVELLFNRKPVAFYRSEINDLAVFPSARDVAELKPHIEKILEFGRDIIVTAKGEDCDFVSRYFAPMSGIPEDPVTGSTHCQLAPYWGGILNKASFFARQISARGGELWCRLSGDRVIVSGHGICVMQGKISF